MLTRYCPVVYIFCRHCLQCVDTSIIHRMSFFIVLVFQTTKRSSQKKKQIDHVRHFSRVHKTEYCTHSTLSTSTSSTMNKQLTLCGKVVVDYVFQKRNIESSSSHICDDKKTNLAFSKHAHSTFSSRHVHVSKDTFYFLSHLSEQKK